MTRLQEVLEEMKGFIQGFEVRQQQFEMMENVYEAMSNQKKAAVHAPTGTGKSFGYLLPYVAVKLDKPDFRITINTNTKALQEQLKKDIDVADKVYRSLLKKHNIPRTPASLNVVALKGNGNYFCEYRYRDAKDDQLPFGLSEDIEKALRSNVLREYSQMDVDIAPSNWEKMNVEGCLKRACPFKEQCTYFQHYSKIDSFDIVIANHALFFFRFLYSDQFWEGFDFHVFDESHKLERGLLDAATNSLTLRQLDTWVFQGAKFAERLKTPESDIDAWRTKYFQHDTYLESKERFDSWQKYFKPPNKAASLQKMEVDVVDVQLWLKRLQEWQVEMVKDMTDNVLSFLPDKDSDDDYLKGRANWLNSLLSLREFGSLSNHQDGIGQMWVELKKRSAHLHVTPISIDHIPSPFYEKGFLLTSGTIAQNQSCQGLAKRLNVEIDIDLVLTTPFPLEKQALVYFTTHIQPKMKDWKHYLTEEIFRMIEVGEKNTFVLFTSSKLMGEVHDSLLTRLYALDTDKPLRVWKQEEGNYQEVVSSFQDEGVQNILFGSKTYFEGIDLKGDNLSQVILTRLPFPVPGHPIQEILERKAGYGQWEALVNYEQAFGRLIRTSTDHGVFHVLDSRVSYMKQFKQLFEHDGIPTTTELEDVTAFYETKQAGK